MSVLLLTSLLIWFPKDGLLSIVHTYIIIHRTGNLIYIVINIGFTLPGVCINKGKFVQR